MNHVCCKTLPNLHKKTDLRKSVAGLQIPLTRREKIHSFDKETLSKLTQSPLAMNGLPKGNSSLANVGRFAIDALSTRGRPTLKLAMGW